MDRRVLGDTLTSLCDKRQFCDFMYPLPKVIKKKEKKMKQNNIKRYKREKIKEKKKKKEIAHSAQKP